MGSVKRKPFSILYAGGFRYPALYLPVGVVTQVLQNTIVEDVDDINLSLAFKLLERGILPKNLSILQQ